MDDETDKEIQSDPETGLVEIIEPWKPEEPFDDPEDNIPSENGSRVDRHGILTRKQRVFCEAFVGPACYSVTKAAQYAGITRMYAQQMLKAPHISKQLATLEHEAWERTRGEFEATKERIQSELSAVAFADITDFLEPSTVVVRGSEVIRWVVRNPRDLPPHFRRAIKKIRALVTPSGDPVFEIELCDKMEALKMLSLWSGGISRNGDGPSLPSGADFSGLNIIPATKGKSNEP